MSEILEDGKIGRYMDRYVKRQIGRQVDRYIQDR